MIKILVKHPISELEELNTRMVLFYKPELRYYQRIITNGFRVDIIRVENSNGTVENHTND